MKTMVTPTEALQIVLGQINPLPSETISLEAVHGRTLSDDVVAEIELPPFDNSAMDGYAVQWEDTASADESHPVVLTVTEVIAAGSQPQWEVTGECCAQIMTGAPLPGGADAVIMREETHRISDSQVQILAPARRGQNIRPAGSDVGKGETVMRAGEVIRAAQWGMLASLNYSEVSVTHRPRVAVITTGDEVIAPGEALAPGQIHDSNSYTLRGVLHDCGALVEIHKLGDDPHLLHDVLLDCGSRCDAIVTSGGVSAGDFDPVRDVLPEVGDVHFWKIAMKPGKPVMFATLKDSAIPVFGLPGNPVSVMVAFEQFVRPALLQMQGRRALRRVELAVSLRSGFRSPAGRAEFVRALVKADTTSGSGWIADITGDQSSGRLSTMTAANALLVVPAEVDEVPEGTLLRAQMTDWPEVE